MNNLNSLLNQHQSSSLQEIIHSNCETQMSSSTHFNPTSSHDNFLEQMMSSIPSSASSFPWADDQPPPAMLGHLDEESAAALALKLRQNQISCGGGAKALILQHQLLLSRSVSATNGLLSPTGADAGLHNDAVDPSSFKTANLGNDASIKSLFSGFNTGSVGQTPNESQHFNHPQARNFGAGSAASPAMSQPAAAQPRQRIRARRGQATDPHSIAERLRRERIAERMKGLQELVPNADKTDKASMLDEIIDYVKFLQLQVKVLSMSRLGGAASVGAQDSHSEEELAAYQADNLEFQNDPIGINVQNQARSSNGTRTASTSQDNEGMAVAEKQVAKLMEEDMGSALQYLQSKGLCLMPISLATTTISDEASGPT